MQAPSVLDMEVSSLAPRGAYSVISADCPIVQLDHNFHEIKFFHHQAAFLALFFFFVSFTFVKVAERMLIVHHQCQYCQKQFYQKLQNFNCKTELVVVQERSSIEMRESTVLSPFFRK